MDRRRGDNRACRMATRECAVVCAVASPRTCSGCALPGLYGQCGLPLDGSVAWQAPGCRAHCVMLWELGRSKKPLPAQIQGLNQLMADRLLLISHCALRGDHAVIVLTKGFCLNLCPSAPDVTRFDGLQSARGWYVLQCHTLSLGTPYSQVVPGRSRGRGREQMQPVHVDRVLLRKSVQLHLHC